MRSGLFDSFGKKITVDYYIFKVKDQPLEGVRKLKYLGIALENSDDEWPKL